MVHNAAVTSTSLAAPSVELQPTIAVRATTAIVLVPTAIGATLWAVLGARNEVAAAVIAVGVAMALTYVVGAVMRAGTLADGDGITVRSTFARTVHRWSDVDDVYLVRRAERPADLLARTTDGHLVSLIPAALRDPNARGGARLEQAHRQLLDLVVPSPIRPGDLNPPEDRSEVHPQPLALRNVGWRRAAPTMLAVALGTTAISIALVRAGHGPVAAAFVVTLVVHMVRIERTAPPLAQVLLRIDGAGISWWEHHERTVAWPDVVGVGEAPGWRRHVVVITTDHDASLVPTWRYRPADVAEAIGSWRQVTATARRPE